MEAFELESGKPHPNRLFRSNKVNENKFLNDICIDLNDLHSYTSCNRKIFSNNHSSRLKDIYIFIFYDFSCSSQQNMYSSQLSLKIYSRISVQYYCNIHQKCNFFHFPANGIPTWNYANSSFAF